MLSDIIKNIKREIEEKNLPFADELSQIEDDFKRMSDFFAMGNHDPEVDKIYAVLKSRAERLQRQAKLYWLTKENRFYAMMLSNTKGNYVLDLEETRLRLEDFVIDLTMLDLEEDEALMKEKRKSIFRKHQEFRKILFAQVFLSPLFDEENKNTLEAIILSSSIDVIDAQLIISALMLSCTNNFDAKKADLLYDIYNKAETEEVSQRALVAYILSVSSIKDINVYDVHKNVVPPALLAQVQQQILYTIDSPRVEKIMQREIMPDVIKNSEFDFQNNKIIPKNPDRLDSILNPHKDEEMIEKMEETMKKMQKLQEEGSDLFFSGFKYVKNNAFFNDITNWFCPFYFDHPQLPPIENEDDKSIIFNLIGRTPFCDSDKYSFVISMKNAISTIPDNMKQMLKSGEAQLDIVGGGKVTHNATFIRRTYLQDIFRFFKICSWARGLINTMDISNGNIQICNFLKGENHGYDEVAISVIKTLRKFNAEKQISALLSVWNPDTSEGRIFKAFYLVADDNSDNVAEAKSLIVSVLNDEPHNVQALFGLVKICFTDMKNKEEWEAYRQEAMNSMLALYFKNENDLSVLHNLVRAYLLDRDFDKAEKYSHELIEKNAAKPFIKTFVGLRNLSAGNISTAISLLKEGDDYKKTYESAEHYGMPLSEAMRDILSGIIQKS